MKILIKDKYVDSLFVHLMRQWDKYQCGGGSDIPMDVIDDIMKQIRMYKPSGNSRPIKGYKNRIDRIKTSIEMSCEKQAGKKLF